MSAVNLKDGYKFYQVTVYMSVDCECLSSICTELDFQSIIEFCLQPQILFSKRAVQVVVQAKNASDAYEKASHVFGGYFTNIGDKIYRALDKFVVKTYYYRVIYNVKDNVWIAKKIPECYGAKDDVVLFNTVAGHVECYVYAPNDKETVKCAKNLFVMYIEGDGH